MPRAWSQIVKGALAGIVIGIVIVIGLALLGGSVSEIIFGAHGLDINGRAVAHGGATIQPDHGWSFYGGDAGGQRFSRASQITPDNVTQLEPAWTYSTGDIGTKPNAALSRSAGETTPILVHGNLVFCSPFNEVIAINPGTGAQIWRYDPAIDLQQRPANQFICRGVAAFQDTTAQGHCAARILSATNDGRLIALDAKSGKLCDDFGESGQVTLNPGMPLLWPGEFQLTSPPVVINDTVVVGSAISDNARVQAPSGVVRAYDVRTGAPRWQFDPIPRSTDAANAADWQGTSPPVEGHANAWAPMAADLKRGLVFIPTSSPSPDFYGGLRPGDNRYANSVVALHAESGKVAWSYQLVHHDIWDFDTPSQPGLYTIWRDGAPIDVVAQTTKMGLVFILDRDTGEPIIPIEERPVPQQAVTGEALSATQPFPIRPPALVPDRTDAAEAFGITWFDKQACAQAIESLDGDGLYTPPTEKGTLMRPFTGGGANWGGSAFDASKNLLVVNMSNIGHLIQLIPQDQVHTVTETLHQTAISPQTGAPFAVRRELLLSPLGLPCTPPPWGIIAAVDIAQGKIVWRKTLGTTQDLAGGLALSLGTPTFGGPIITAGGIVFIASTLDYYLRAIDLDTGNELWKGRLPTSGTATPMSYEWQGRQYVVISAGGNSNAGAPAGDSLVAFALPDA